jgi:dienelactone hydrolase
MELERLSIGSEDGDIPAVMLTPPAPRGAAVVIHGYGGNKEEVLGLASRVAAAGLVTCALDLRGHGENTRPLDPGVARDVEAGLSALRRFGKVAAVGHSLGGRLALLSSADFAFALSPALARDYGATTRRMLEDLRSYRVRESEPGTVFEVLRALPEWLPSARPAAIVFGSRDVPEIVAAGRAWGSRGVAVTVLPAALHPDIIQLEATFAILGRQLASWF